MRYFNVLVGPMSSGKTTFAGRFWPAESATVHTMNESPPGAVEGLTPAEAVRLSAASAWESLRLAAMAWSALDIPPCFVADGLFMSRQSRQAVLDLVPRGPDIRTIGWFLDTPVQTLIGRFRGRVASGEFRSVPKEVLAKQLMCFELPSPDEPFDMWIRVPVQDQEGVSTAADPLEAMSHRVMFTGGDRVPWCDFLTEANKVQRYRFKDLGGR